MAYSNYTKRLKKKLWIFRILNLILLFVPVIVYAFIALCDGGVTVVGRVSVVSSVMISLILTAFNVITKHNLKCPRWIILIGVYVAMKESILPLVIMLAVTSVLDDFFFTPIISTYRSDLIANKAIDRRMGDSVREEI